VPTCNSSYSDGKQEDWSLRLGRGKNETLSEKQTKSKRTGGHGSSSRGPEFNLWYQQINNNNN
jgi:hypothetical protein